MYVRESRVACASWPCDMPLCCRNSDINCAKADRLLIAINDSYGSAAYFVINLLAICPLYRVFVSWQRVIMKSSTLYLKVQGVFGNYRISRKRYSVMSDQSVIHNAQEEQNTSVDFARPWLRHY